MRNLIGRLNARTPSELEIIAREWRVPLSGRDKLARVATLYRAMTTHWVARELWDRLEPGHREVVTALVAAGDRGASLKDLAATLGREVADLRAAATALYRAGILARDGDDDHLPIGEEPRLFVPRELIQELTQVRDERARGDTSDRPLREHLDTLDDRELEEAAERWGARVVAGATGRETLVRQILAATGDPRRREAVVRSLDAPARELWDTVRALDPPAPIPLESARRLAGAPPAGEAGDDPRPGFAFLSTLADLEEALLLLPTVVDGAWGVAVQREAASGVGPAAGEAALTPVAVVGLEPERRHPHTVAWDVLTIVQQLTGPGSDPELDPLDLPESVCRRLTGRLWNGPTAPSAEGYIQFLLTLAADQGLLDEPAEGDTFRRTEELKPWRLKGFAAQSAALRQRWLRHADWVENEGREDIEVRSADWSAFRLKLLTQLGALGAGAWFDVVEVGRWVAGRSPEILGASAQVATAWASGDGLHPGGVAAVVQATLETGFAWFGLVELASPGRDRRLVRLTPAGLALARAEPPPEPEAPPRPGLEVAHDGTVALTDPTPLQVWSVLAFAEPVALGSPATYRLTEASVRAALAAGFDLEQITGFLEKQQGSPLPDRLAARLEGWRSGAKRVRLASAVLLASDDEGTRETVRQLLTQDGYRVTAWDGRLLVETGLRRDAETDAKRLDALLRATGITISRVEPKGS